MSNPNPKSNPAREPSKPPASGGDTMPKPAPVPNFFRRVDWITCWVTTALVMLVYLWTLAPDVTLEDSGELAVASYYAGVPHPPGYPIWTIYTWLFTQLVPISNIAWRVALSSAVAGAFACGLVGLLASRGSSMILESIEGFKNLDRQLEDRICFTSGVVAGLLIGFNGFMWSQAVIVEVYTLSVWSFMGVLAFLMRWAYAPHQRKYFYWAAFLFGVCMNNHQTLVVATMGIELLVLAIHPRLGRDLFAVNALCYILGLYLKKKGMMQSLDQSASLSFIYHSVGVGSLLIAGWVVMKTQKLFTEWKSLLISCLVFGAGLLFYFYMPLASMTNPPLNWGYPRTEQGFWHALTRGQYDKTNPTSDPVRFVQQVAMYVEGAIEEFTLVGLALALLPFIFYKHMQKRERGWIVGMTAIYALLAFLLLVLLNPNTDKQSKEQTRVFFAASHLILAMFTGYGITILAGLVATRFEEYKRHFLWASAVASAFALYALVDRKSQFFLDMLNASFGLAICLVLVAVFYLWGGGGGTWAAKIPWLRRRLDEPPLPVLLSIFLVMPLYSAMAHWADNEQRGHLFGYWFGHDMFTPPFDLYPEMEKQAVLFGGTDPGRFNPTYMIFCESFIPPSKKRDPKFDRRDVYLITQNALADGTYLDYIRAHYNRSAQHDPFFFVNFLRTAKQEELGRTNAFARMFLPVDRFFTKLGAKIERSRRAKGIYPPADDLKAPPPEVVNDPYSVGEWHSKEILTPTVEESQRSFAEYIQDAQRRLQHDMAFPNEPKQIKPGEDVRIVDNKISVAGQTAVMAINGLLTKVIFDNNPSHEFYVEESFPLDWMFPYLTPYGIIMKLNRQPVPEITEEMVKRDHDFWSLYSERLIGNWITYDTPVAEICEFVKKIYLRRDYSGFKGDPKFVRDDNAQKAFSKLRSAIGGLYFWRVTSSKNPAENQRMLREAEFALKQSFAYCPYSPEAVYKYVTLLVNLGRTADADLIIRACIEFDPENAALAALQQNIVDIQRGQAQNLTVETQLMTLRDLYLKNPTNLNAAFNLASAYIQLQRTNEAVQLLESLMNSPTADASTVFSVAGAFSQIGAADPLERALKRLVTVVPDNPEAWYDLARAQAVMGKNPESISALRNAFILSNARLKQHAGSPDLIKDALTNSSLVNIRRMPDFAALLDTAK